jgi:hypothetical protein
VAVFWLCVEVPVAILFATLVVTAAVSWAVLKAVLTRYW